MHTHKYTCTYIKVGEGCVIQQLLLHNLGLYAKAMDPPTIPNRIKDGN